VAVGNYVHGKVDYTMAERWNGQHWTLMNTPDAVNDYPMSGVSCVAVTSCWAVDNPMNGTGIEHLDGNKGWKVVSTPSIGIGGYLGGISCSTPPLACMAVGTQDEPMGLSNWYNLDWTRPGPWVASGSAPSLLEPQAQLSAVSCTSDSFCLAVGSQEYLVSYNNENPVWGEEPIGAPLLFSGTDNVLTGVSCSSPSNCIVIGEPQPILWNGTTWSVIPNPATGGVSAVSCVSATFCVGLGGGGAQQWNGTSWSAMTGDAVGTSVSCTSTTNCMAVAGVAVVGGGTRTNTTHWNGMRWSPIPSPNR